jgi:hypothetical protein
MCTEERLEQDQEFLTKVVTGDKTQVYEYNTKKGKSCVSCRASCLCTQKGKLCQHVKSMIMCVFWHSQTSVLWVCFTRTKYKLALLQLHLMVSAGKFVVKTIRKSGVICFVTMSLIALSEFLAKNKMTVLPHLPCPPNLVPCELPRRVLWRGQHWIGRKWCWCEEKLSPETLITSRIVCVHNHCHKLKMKCRASHSLTFCLKSSLKSACCGCLGYEILSIFKVITSILEEHTAWLLFLPLHHSPVFLSRWWRQLIFRECWCWPPRLHILMTKKITLLFTTAKTCTMCMT